MVVQDDARERELIELFKLERVAGAGRGDTDAKLVLDEADILFELKSSTDGSVTTVRDFGPDHVAKWKKKHWLIGFYDKDGSTLKSCIYGSPEMMDFWVKEKEKYIQIDFQLAQCVPPLIDLELLFQILGKKDLYTIADAKLLHKRQYTKAKYMSQCDLAGGYSPARMLDILKERCSYLIRRGSTLNNPHIPATYFQGWERISDNHAVRLRELVADALKREAEKTAGVAQAALESAREIDNAT